MYEKKIAEAAARDGNMGTSAHPSGTREDTDAATKPDNFRVLFENCHGEKQCEPTIYEIDSKCLKSVVERPAHAASDPW